jgi:hypothetical protein
MLLNDFIWFQFDYQWACFLSIDENFRLIHNYIEVIIFCDII